MTTVPANTVTMEDMVEWQKLQAQLAKIKAAEMLLRRKIYDSMFVTPKEGTNTMSLSQGWVLKGKRVISREIDLPVLQAFAVENGPLHQIGVRADDLVDWKPVLKIAAYRSLTAEQVAVFDQCLTIKDGAPGLEIMLPAAAKKGAV